MWAVCFILSVACVVILPSVSLYLNSSEFGRKHKFNLFNTLFAGVFIAAVFMFFPVHRVAAEPNLWGLVRSVLLSLFNSMQIFAIGCEFGVVVESMGYCPDWLSAAYHAWVSFVFVVAPIFTFGFVLSLFKNLSAWMCYVVVYFKSAYVFSELNEKSLALAADIKKNNKNASIIFTDVFAEEENMHELVGEAKELGAICMKQDILVFNFANHSGIKPIYFFAIGLDETENLNQSLKLIERYKDRPNTSLYVFSTKLESELLLTSVDKGEMKVRRVNEVRSLINRVLYERGEIIFESARETDGGEKKISALVIGMGMHGTEMVKALSWYGQMNGYSLEINAFDRDPLAEEKFKAKAPELMSTKYNGVFVEGEARYSIAVHSGIDAETSTFCEEISKLKDTTYVLVALGNDDININTAVNLRTCFERMGICPIIQTIIYNSQQKRALEGIMNFKKQHYNIEFIGDAESSYTEEVIIDSDLESDALARHMKWGEEDDFWTYEYNYRSSIASAIHMRARIKCGIPGADKLEGELTPEERENIEVLEHRRWNAYMRAEGYVFSGSSDKSTRNDLGKMHNDLVDFSSLSEEEKRKDGSVGTL